MKLTTLIFSLGIGLFAGGFNATVYAVETGATADSDFEQSFQAGVAKYQDKKYDEARLSFTDALQKNPQSVQTLVNLALAQFQLGKKGEAVALLRKAQNLDPDFSTPQAALKFILPQLDVKEIPHEIQLWETVRSSFIVPFSMTAFLALNALAFFSTGWLFLVYFGKRRKALREDLPLPVFPLIPTVILAVFVSILGLTILKALDYRVPRGTIVSEKITVLSAPAEKSPSLFDLYAGLEVVLSSVEGDWVQVTYPGAMTGWIPKSSIFQTSGRNLW
jgi:tetratricopeptide (TPR) repeat protein